MRALIASLLASICLLAAGTACAQTAAAGQVEGSVTAGAASPAAEESALAHWWLGGYYRHLWIPGYVTDLFLSRAPAVSNDGFGAVATYRSSSGFNVEMGFGYAPYAFHGPFLADGMPIEDTELVRSDLALWHLTGSVLWDIEFHPVVALELGVGLDLGFFSGKVIRNEAYLDPATGRFADCAGPLDPPVVGPNGDPYCNVPEHGGSTDRADQKGEQYHVREGAVPPVMLFPMLPRVGLRLQPLRYLAIKAEFAFGIAQMWAGVSLHVGFGLFAKHASPSPVQEVAPPPPAMGRVLGRVLDAESGAPVAGATVRVSGRALSPLTSEDDGRFVVDRLDPGLVQFDIEHADYAPAKCRADVPASGGDVALDCQLTPKPRLGAISGQLVDEAGNPVAGQPVQLLGPRNDTLTSDEHGSFAAVDLPPGTYRVRVDAADFLVQMVEVQVAPQETATPKIVLIKKPKHALVELRKQEIVIAEQVQFQPNSAEIAAASEGLLRQVADVLLRNPQIEQVEVQGHTDSTGTRALNMKLSQARADAVRAWLVDAGVAPERLTAEGYGPDHPLRPNNTAQNRAKNRRVQFIIKRQAAAEPAP